MTLFTISICFVCGVLAGALFPLPPASLLVLGSGFALAGLVVAKRTIACAVCLLIGVMLTGAGLSAISTSPRKDPSSVAHHTGRKPVRLFARVAAPTLTIAGLSNRTRLEVRAIVKGGKTIPVHGFIELRQPAGSFALNTAEEIVFWTRLKPATAARNPGLPSSQLRLRLEDIDALAWSDDSSMMVLKPSKPSWLEATRRRIRRAIEIADLGERPQKVLQAVVLGDRQALDHPTKQLFARAGVSHLLAVSGLHLSLVAGGLFFALRRILCWCGLQRTDPSRVAAPFAALGAVTYTLLTGAAPSTVRACVIAVACFVGLFFARPPNLKRPLCLAAILMLAWEPLSLFRPGFQLSFAAVVGIGLVFSRRDHETTKGPSTRRQRIFAWIKRLWVATFAATLITAPFVALHFGEVSIVGLLTNLFAIPLTTMALLPLGLIGGVFSLIAPQLAEPFFVSAGWAAFVLVELSRICATWSYAVFPASPGWLMTSGCFFGAVALLAPPGRWRKAAWVLAALIMLSWGASALFVELRHSEKVELTFLDVGQGDSTLLEFPNGKTMLIDGGGSEDETWDPGSTRVVPALRAGGVEHLDWVVATHPHADHIGGLRAVLKTLSVGELWICWYDQPDRWLDKLLSIARERNVRIVRPRKIHSGAVTIQPLWPRGFETFCGDPGYSANDNSIVLRVEYGQAAILLTGDIEEPVEHALTQKQQTARLLRADLLKVPHHGSPTSSTDQLLEAVAPRLAVISCGSGNLFGLPDPGVIKRYRRNGIEVARTDQLGAIRVLLGKDGQLEWSATTSWTR